MTLLIKSFSNKQLKNIMVVRTVTQCNKFFSAKTPYPLVAVIRLSDTADITGLFQFGFHSIWFRKWAG